MADTTATLGIAVESGEASRNLKDFSAVVKQLTDAATKFEANLSRLNRGIGELPSTLRNANNEAGRHASQMERTATSTQKASAAATVLTSALRAMIAALAGGAIYKAIELSVNKLAELGDMASDTRLGKDFLQGLRIGAAEARVSTSELNSAIEAFTKVSKQAVPEAKEFYKALSAISPSLAQAFKDQSGKAGGQEERLKIIADALKNARSETERYQLAQKALGTDSDRVIELFVRGRQALDEYISKAREYGILVDDAFIKKAQDAQRTLGTLTTVIADKLRVAIVDLLPDLMKLVPVLERVGALAMDFIANSLTPEDRPTSTLTREMDDVNSRLANLRKEREAIINKPGSVFDWVTGGKDTSAVDASIKKYEDYQKRINGILTDRNMASLKPDAPANDNKPAGFSGRSSLRDNPFDSQINSIQKHIAALNADADAVGKTAAEHVRLRVEAQLVEAGLRSGLSEAAVRSSADFKRLGDAAEAAAQKLALARVQNQIKFDRNTAFLTQEDVAIASQLKGLYPDVATAMGSVEAQAMRANNAMRELSNLGQDVNRGLLVEFGQQIRNGASAWDAFKNAGLNALGKIADKLMGMAADNLWRNAFGGSSGGLLGGLGSLLGFGGASSAAGSVGVVGAAGDMVVPTFFHGGGVVGYDGYQNGTFPASMFRDAPRFHEGKRPWGPDEIPAILRSNEAVLTPRQLAAVTNSGARSKPQNITIEVSVNGARGNKEIQDMVAAGVATGLSQYDAALPSKMATINQRVA